MEEFEESIMSVLDLLANPGFGNILLLITALIGVVGSYQIYRIRVDDRRNATRRALKAEIESNSTFDTWIRQNEPVEEAPAQVIHPTTAYEGHIDGIGLLTDEEIEVVSEFYSNAILTNDVIKWNRESDLQLNLNPNLVDRGRARRFHDISKDLDRLAVDRWKAAQVLRKNLGEDYTPIKQMELPTSPGETVSKHHPVIKPHIEEFVNEGYLKQVSSDSNLYELTEEGESFFNTEGRKNDSYDLEHELSLT